MISTLGHAYHLERDDQRKQGNYHLVTLLSDGDNYAIAYTETWPMLPVCVSLRCPRRHGFCGFLFGQKVEDLDDVTTTASTICPFPILPPPTIASRADFAANFDDSDKVIFVARTALNGEAAGESRDFVGS